MSEVSELELCAQRIRELKESVDLKNEEIREEQLVFNTAWITLERSRSILRALSAEGKTLNSALEHELNLSIQIATNFTEA